MLMETIEDLRAAMIDFTHVDSYTTFSAEYGFKGSDIVIHFFLPVDFVRAHSSVPLDDADLTSCAQWIIDNKPTIKAYWQGLFPQILEPVAQSVFRASPPRVAAAYTPEVVSWWFQAKGFRVLRPELLINHLFEHLDQILDRAGAVTTLVVSSNT